MKFRIFLFVTLVFISEFSVHSENIKLDADPNESIKFAFYIFRHGARAPRLPNKKGEYKDAIGVSWDGYVYNQLTATGKRQHYILGLEKREMYKDLLGKDYATGEIYSYTSTIERAINSNLAHQQGLYEGYSQISLTNEQQKRAFPPGPITEEEQKLSEETLSPVGLHFTNIFAYHQNYEVNHYMKFDDDCFGISNADKYYYESDIKKLLEEFYSKYKTTLNELGFNLDESKLTDRKYLYDQVHLLMEFKNAYVCEYFENKLQKDYFPGAPEKEEEFRNNFERWNLDAKYLEEYKKDNNYNARILTSKLFRNIIDNYLLKRILLDSEEKTMGKYTDLDPKLLVYSMHDDDLSAIMYTLNYAIGLKFENIPFASSYDFQLVYKQPSSENGNNSNNLKNEFLSLSAVDTKNYFIRILYNNVEVYKDSFDGFNTKMQRTMIDSDTLSVYCHFQNEKTVWYIIIVVISSIVSLGLLVYIVYALFFRKRSRENEEEILI